MSREIERCAGGSCPTIDPVTGRYTGENTMQASVEGVAQRVKVKKEDLIPAARGVRANALLSLVGGERTRDQVRTVSAATMEGQAVTAEVGGATLVHEARLTRLAQSRDIFQAAGQALRRNVSRPVRT